MPDTRRIHEVMEKAADFVPEAGVVIANLRNVIKDLLVENVQLTQQNAALTKVAEDSYQKHKAKKEAAAERKRAALLKPEDAPKG